MKKSHFFCLFLHYCFFFSTFLSFERDKTRLKDISRFCQQIFYETFIQYTRAINTTYGDKLYCVHGDLYNSYNHFKIEVQILCLIKFDNQIAILCMDGFPIAKKKVKTSALPFKRFHLPERIKGSFYLFSRFRIHTYCSVLWRIPARFWRRLHFVNSSFNPLVTSGNTFYNRSRYKNC